MEGGVKRGWGNLAEEGVFLFVVVEQKTLGRLEHEPLLLERLLSIDQTNDSLFNPLH